MTHITFTILTLFYNIYFRKPIETRDREWSRWYECNWEETRKVGSKSATPFSKSEAFDFQFQLKRARKHKVIPQQYRE
jgi:hypothetical protein